MMVSTIFGLFQGKHMGRSRSQDTDFFDDLFDLLCLVPIWVGPILAVVVFAIARWAFPALLIGLTSGNEVADISTPVFANVSRGIAPILAGLVLMMWIVAEIRKLAQRRRTAQAQAISAEPAIRTSRPPLPGQTATAEPSPATKATCPDCGAEMIRRTAKRGINAGSTFWGCSRYPDCKGTRELGSEFGCNERW